MTNPTHAPTTSCSPFAAAVALLPAAALISAIFQPNMAALAKTWNLDPNYSHGPLVPVVALWIAWDAWRRDGGPLRGAVAPLTTAWGLTVIVCGLTLHAAATLVGNLLVDVLSLVFVLRGLLLVLGGAQTKAAFGFAAWFLIFMAPLPVAWYQPLAICMQQLVSGISTCLLDMVDVPVNREGYMIHLPGYTLEVGEACSGLRQLTAIVAMGVGLGYFSRRGLGYRWVLGLASVPIAVVANCLRVMVTGLILIWFGREWAEGVYHTAEGLVIVALAAALEVVAAWRLGKLADRWWGP